MASELKPCQIADALEKCDWAGASIGNKAIVSLAIEALRNARPAPVATPADATDEMVEAALAVDWDNEDERATVHNIWHAMTAKITSSPAPAATDTGLETRGWEVKRYGNDGKRLDTSLFIVEPNIASSASTEIEELCRRSQAVELLAAKDKLIQSLIDFDSEEVKRLEADNAAKDARIKELETERTMIVSHATMGQTDGIGLTVNDISVRVSALRNELYEEGEKRAEALGARIKALDHENNCWMKSAIKQQKRSKALEAKLAAAEKALEPFGVFGDETISPERRHFLQLLICPEGDEHPENYGPHFRKARAALGGKPS